MIYYVLLFAAAFIIITLCAIVIPFCRSKMTEEEYASVVEWINYAVKAAEQIFKSGSGEEKKGYVLAFLDAIGVGKSLSSEEIDVAIESAVYDMKQEKTE